MPGTEILLIFASYLIGSIPFGLLIGKHYNIDIRQQGSCNIGATNVARVVGKKMGILTLILDFSKGIIPIWIASLIYPDNNKVIAVAGAAAVIGHMFPIYLKFKGGKGVATGLGLFVFLSPFALLTAIGAFILVVYLTGFVSLGSLVMATLTPTCMYFLSEPDWKIMLSLFITLLIWWKHRSNVQRLLKGKEKSWKKRSKSE